MMIMIIYFVGWLTYKQLEVIFPGGTIIFIATSQYTEVGIDPLLLKQGDKGDECKPYKLFGGTLTCKLHQALSSRFFFI